MTNTIIDSFIDGERVDPAAIDAVLATADGREYFIDALALRSIVRIEPAAPVLARRERPALLRFAAAAGIGMALLGAGYLAGVRAVTTAAPAVESINAEDAAPPEPTRVIELKPGVNWHETKGGD